MFNQSFCFFYYHFCNLNVSACRLVKGRANYFPSTFLCISVTSSGRSSIRSTINSTSGLFLVIAFARFCNNTVLPALGGATIKALLSLTNRRKHINYPGGHVTVLWHPCHVEFLVWKIVWCKVVEQNLIFFAISGSSKLVVFTFNKAKYLSPSFGGRMLPVIVSPVLKLNFFICDGDTYISSGPGR